LNFSPLCTTYTTQVLQRRISPPFSSVQLCASSIWCRSYTPLVPIRSCIGRIEKNRRERSFTRTEFSFATQELAPPVPRLQSTAVDQVCSPSDKQELPLPSTKATAHSSSQVCSSSDTRTSIHQYCLYSNCSRSSLQAPTTLYFPNLQALSLVDATPLPTLSFVWQIKPTIPTTLLFHQSLQLHPSFSSLLPTATPYTTFGISGPTVKPKDYLLIQPRTVDCPYIYPYSIPKYFLQ